MKKYRALTAFLAAVLIAAQSSLFIVPSVSYAEDSTVSAGEPPQMPDGEGPGGEMGTPPDKPDGEAPDGEMGTPPDKPDGDAPDGGGPGGAGGGSAVTEWSAATDYSTDTSTSGQSYDSTGTDENAVHVSGGEVVLDDPTITRNSSDSTGGDNSSFYGVGAALLATDGTAYVSGGTIDTDSAGGAGAFAYGDGTIYISDTVINTNQNTSGGIHAAGGGTLYAWDVTAETNGESSAAIRSDRGGGTMVIDGGTYTSNGVGSPAVYCTADIAVNNAVLNATGSEGVCIEGLNSLALFDSDLSCNMPVTEQNEGLTWAVIVYQSMSGDSEVGNSEFYMDGGSISGNGDIFYTTNTESHITVKNTAITSSADDYAVLRCTGNANGRGWGSSGANGADCTFTAIQQTLEGNVIYDSISNLTFYLTDSSSLTGAVLDDETDAGDGGDAVSDIYIDSSSTWIVTADSICTDLYCEGTIVDTEGNAVAILDADGNVLSEGTSEVTVTVTGEYSQTADTSGATAVKTFDDYSVEKPVQLSNITDGADNEVVLDEAEQSEDTAQAETTAAAESESSSESEGVNGGIIAALIAGAAAVAAIIAAYVFKKKK